MKKIIFTTLNSKYIHVSSAPFYVASHYKKIYYNEKDIDIEVLYFTINEDLDLISKKILSYNPSLISFSVYIWNVEKTFFICKKIKEYNENIKIILGGPEVAFRSDKEKEEIIKSGIANEISTNEYDDNPNDACYLSFVKGRIAYFESQRGCPFNCAFCLSGRVSENKVFPLEETYKNIITLAKAKPKIIKFVDRTFNSREQHANNILNFILENSGKTFPKDIQFHFEIAGDILKDSTFEILKKMPKGLVQVEIGLQTFNKKSLESINRKTNIEVLVKNIKKLLEYKNIHVHIDLIAGLPYENIISFIESFNMAYSLKAHMIQFGFLKILYGSPLKELLDNENKQTISLYYDKNAPYEVRETKWIQKDFFDVFKYVEDSLDRLYNSHRFINTLNYVFDNIDYSPFMFFLNFGYKYNHSDYKEKNNLDDYTEFFYNFCLQYPNIKKSELRDNLVIDRLQSNRMGKLPQVLKIKDDKLSKIKKCIPIKKSVKQAIAILYSKNQYIYINYDEESFDSINKIYKVHYENLDDIK
ncbi:MAG: DUF4080 domain-containing protein [Eubacteriales bacterium]|nr:DUF4080 domain-containing protein [Eubacteriales bacterium]